MINNNPFLLIINDSTKQKDVNECLVEANACKEREYCENNIGSFTCFECDPACKTACSGKGADKCIGECSSGYRSVTDSAGTRCIDINECEEKSEKPVCGERLKCLNTIGGYECVGKL